MENNIAVEIINKKIDAKENFSLTSINQEIIDSGGILRVSGTTIKVYLGELIALGILNYFSGENLFSPTEIADSPAKWTRTKENPFITAMDQDF